MKSGSCKVLAASCAWRHVYQPTAVLIDEAAQSTANEVRDVVARQGEDDSDAAAAADHVAEAIEHDPTPTMPAEEALARQEREHLPGPTQLHAVAYSLRNSRIHTYEALDNFWKRYNKVLAESLDLVKACVTDGCACRCFLIS
jgi:hypothetical protein